MAAEGQGQCGRAGTEAAAGAREPPDTVNGQHGDSSDGRRHGDKSLVEVVVMIMIRSAEGPVQRPTPAGRSAPETPGDGRGLGASWCHGR